MKKKIISVLCTLTLIMSLGVTAVFADETASSSLFAPMSDQASFSFSLQKGAASSSSARAWKNDTSAAEVYPQSGNVSASNNVAFRVRNYDNTEATGLYVRDDMNSFGMYYYSGSPTPAYKYLYANAPSTNSSTYVSVAGVWYP